MSESEVIGTGEAARVIGVSATYVSVLVRAGRLVPVGKVGHRYALLRDQVEAFAQQRQQRQPGRQVATG